MRIRCRGCGKFATDDKLCLVCGKSPDPDMFGFPPRRWGEGTRYVWRIIVEMGIRDNEEYFETVWNR
jgi:hypothetical protein